MMRIGMALLIALAATVRAPDAWAGDGAAFQVIGFSADGRYFAYEQYGEQDGSGTLYSIVSAVEIAGNRVIKGMPVTAILDPENPLFGTEPRTKQLAAIRAQAATDAAAMLAQLGIIEPGQMVAAPRDNQAGTMIEGDQVRNVIKALVTTVPLPADRFGAGTRLVLREFGIATPRCGNLASGEHPAGFELTLERRGRPTIHLSRDQAIPASRSCPEHYGIAEVHAKPLPDGSRALAVVIHYFYNAFEGPNRRFLVVSGRVGKH